MRKGYIRTIPFQDMSNFIELVNKNNSLNNLAGNIQAMSYIIENSGEIFKPLLEKYSNEGNVEAMISLASIFPDFALKKSFFNSFLARAYLKSNRPEDLLSELEARSNKKNRLFSITAFHELLKFPHLEDRVVELAKSYLNTSSFDLPLTVVWSHYFSSEQYEKAYEISKVTPIPVDKVDAVIFRRVQEGENIELGKRYVEFVSCRDYKDRVKERAYGMLLDLLVLKQMHDEAVNLVMDAKSKNVNLEKHYQSTLSTLKSSLERENKPVPFSLDVSNDS
uniref:Uncharacterized protein n=1 Tax=Parasteatoda tepidariorum TaxID=114398 RepID=A0A2L2Y549_PARTP